MEKLFEVSVVGGAGHIGLPLSCYISSFNHKVNIIDNNIDALKKIKNKVTPFEEELLDEFLKNAVDSGMNTSTKLKDIEKSDFVIVTLGTSPDKTDIELFHDIISNLSECIKNDAVLILRSTLSPNDLKRVKENNNLKRKNILISYCPERIAEGKSLIELPLMPQIIGTDSNKEYKIVEDFFNSLSISCIHLSISEAIFLKLFTNTYRYSQFTAINEFFNIANENGIDFDKVFSVATDNYPRLENIPSRGFVGGPCLIKDSEAFLNSYDTQSSFIDSLKTVNDQFMNNIINICKTEFLTKEVIFLGLTFKPNSDDLRTSLSFELHNILVKEGFKLYPVDKFVKHDQVDFELYTYEEVKDFTNNIVISTNHDYFKDFDLINAKVVRVGNK